MRAIKSTVISAALVYLLLRFSISTDNDRRVEAGRITDELMRKMRQRTD